MPPKQRERSGNRSGGTRRPVEKGTAPTSTRDPERQQVNKELLQRDKKEQITHLQQDLDLKKIESDREIKRTLERIHSLQKDNDRIQRKQILEYGMTLDTIEYLSYMLEVTKSENGKLYEEMATTKNLHDKLDAELRTTKHRFEETMEQLTKLENDAKIWKATKDRLITTETRSQDLISNNKKLRIILLKNHIDPRTDARELHREQDKESVKSVKTVPESKPRRIAVRGRYNEMGDVSNIRKINKDFLRKGFGVSDSTFDQVSPAYLRYYIKDFVDQEDNREPDYPYRQGVTLPRVFAKY